jgi:hypothetical protein
MSEQYAYLALGRMGPGLAVRHVDDGSEPGMHDAVITFPDGHEAALEVTALANSDIVTMRRSADTEIPHSVPLRLEWIATYSGLVPRKEMRKWLPILADLCEQQGETDVDFLAEEQGHPALDWYRDSEITAFRGFRTSRPGVIKTAMAAGGAAWVNPVLFELTDFVNSLPGTATYDDNVAKLYRSGYAELHLYLSLELSMIPPELLVNWWSDNPVTLPPADEITLPPPLTDLWLDSGIEGLAVFHWSRTTGWEVHPYPGD